MSQAIVRYLREHPWARRGLSLLSIGLLLGAVGLLGYPFYTNLYQDRLQGKLNRQFASPDIEQAYRNRTVDVGKALTRIKIPALNVDTLVVEGTSASALRAGAGHYPATPLPCEPGNVAIAGHRTTYGKPFANLERLEVNDIIVLETPIGSCTYQVTDRSLTHRNQRNPFIVDPSDWRVVAQLPNRYLVTLTSCHPKGSAKQRIIIQAELVKGAVKA